jgi:hypothetical protein
VKLRRDNHDNHDKSKTTKKKSQFPSFPYATDGTIHQKKLEVNAGMKMKCCKTSFKKIFVRVKMKDR